MSDQFDPYHQWFSIPPEEQPPNHYRLLGLRLFESNNSVISIAADRQSLLVRSFQMGEYADISQQMLSEIANAKLCLLNPQKKTAYDELLRASAQKATAVKVSTASRERQQRVPDTNQPKAEPPELDWTSQLPSPSPGRSPVAVQRKKKKASSANATILCAVGTVLLIPVFFFIVYHFVNEPSAPELKPFKLASNQVEAGELVTFVAGIYDAEQWQGQIKFSLDKKPPGAPVARIDAETGEFGWRPRMDEVGGRYTIAIRVESLQDPHLFTTKSVTVSVVAPRSPPSEFGFEETDTEEDSSSDSRYRYDFDE